MLAEKCQLGTIHYVDMATITGSLDKPVVAGPPLGHFGRLGSTLGNSRAAELGVPHTS
jgi:hypothetical protein